MNLDKAMYKEKKSPKGSPHLLSQLRVQQNHQANTCNTRTLCRSMQGPMFATWAITQNLSCNVGATNFG